MNESINDGLNEGTNGWMGEWMVGWSNEAVNEWMNEWNHDWLNEWMKSWMNDWTNEISQWMIECMNEWVVDEWVNSWNNEWVMDEWRNSWMFFCCIGLLFLQTPVYSYFPAIADRWSAMFQICLEMAIWIYVSSNYWHSALWNGEVSHFPISSFPHFHQISYPALAGQYQ